MTSSTSLWGTEFTCLAFMYVSRCCRIVISTVKSKVRLIGSVLFQVYNKVDQISIEEVDRLAHRSNSVVIRSDLCVVWQQSFPNLFMFILLDMFQLWDEVEPGLPSGDAVGILVPHLHLYQEKRRCTDTFLGLLFTSVTCTQMHFF